MSRAVLPSAESLTAANPPAPLRMFFVCTGVGIYNRGIESFFREAFDGLHDLDGFDITLYKGSGPAGEREKRLWCIPKTSRLGRFLGRSVRRESYVIEQYSSLLPLLWQIRRHRPQVLFLSDPALLRRLSQLRPLLGVDFRILFSNGLPLPGPYPFADYTQQVLPTYFDEAQAAGEEPVRMEVVPYGITVPPGPPACDPTLRQHLRKTLGLPTDRPIVLTVGWVSRRLKRMDYVIEELAGMGSARPFLVILGALDHRSPPILKLAQERLGADHCAIRSVPYEQVSTYYQMADVFTLASLREGFGRVYLEALMHGLPCVVHDAATTRYVLGAEGTYAHLERPGALAREVAQLLQNPRDPAAAARRRDFVRRRFSWEALRGSYATLFRRAAAIPPRRKCTSA